MNRGHEGIDTDESDRDHLEIKRGTATMKRDGQGERSRVKGTPVPTGAQPGHRRMDERTGGQNRWAVTPGFFTRSPVGLSFGPARL